MSKASEYVAALNADNGLFGKAVAYASRMDRHSTTEKVDDLFFITFSDGSQAAMYEHNKRRQPQFANQVWETEVKHAQ